MELYAAFDLHGNNNFLALIDSNGKRIFGKRLLNDRERILEVLRPYQKDLIGIVVESTYNWYWMVDALKEEGYSVHLANPSAIQQYEGLKHADDEHDSFWLKDPEPSD